MNMVLNFPNVIQLNNYWTIKIFSKINTIISIETCVNNSYTTSSAELKKKIKMKECSNSV